MRRRDQLHREQPGLFDDPSDAVGEVKQIDPNVARLRGQNQVILERLGRGPATNDELSRIGRKYTSRISDVRRYLEQRGRTIVCDRGEGGLNTYRIVSLQNMES